MFIMTKNGWRPLWTMSDPRPDYQHDPRALGLDGRTISDSELMADMNARAAAFNEEQRQKLLRLRQSRVDSGLL